METLYSLTSDYLALLELSGSDDPEDQEAFETTLEGLLACIDQKADCYATVLVEMSGRTDIITNEINRLTAIKRSLESNQKRMKERLLETMKITGRDSIKTDLHTFKIAKNGGKLPLIIEEGANVPDKWCKVIVEPDKDKIRTALETGNTEVLSFAHLGERGEHLNIK